VVNNSIATGIEENTAAQDPDVISGGDAAAVFTEEEIDDLGGQAEAAAELSEITNVTDREVQSVTGGDPPAEGPTDEQQAAVVDDELQEIASGGSEPAPTPTPTPTPDPEQSESESESVSESVSDTESELAETVGSVTRDRPDPTADTTAAEAQASREIDEAVAEAATDAGDSRHRWDTHGR